MFLFLLNSVLGALFRRYWGGWIEFPNPPIVKKYFKLTLGYALSFLLTWIATNGAMIEIFGHALPVALCMAIWIGTFWLAPIPPGHAYGTWMGNFGKPDNKGRIHTIAGDFLALAACYLYITVPVGLMAVFLAHDAGGWFYMPLGALAPVPYFVAMKIWEWFKIPQPATSKPGVFIDSYPCIGELALGIIVYGGLALL